MDLHCEGCGAQLNASSNAVYQLVTGWSKLEGGKPKQTLKGRRHEQRFACGGCVDAMAAAGVYWQQPSLFD